MKKVLAKLQPKTLKSRFLVKVLIPPFAVLLVISIAGYFLLQQSVMHSVRQEMLQSSSTTAASLERELSLRKSVLKATGSELFNIRADYSASRTNLEKQRDECKEFVRTNRNFTESPNRSCDPFLAEFAKDGHLSNLPQKVENGYVEQATQLNLDEQEDISERLDAFNSFFPETRALLVTDTKGKIISQASSGNVRITNAVFQPIIDSALKDSVKGERLDSEERLVVFAYPIDDGSVVGVYDIDHTEFLHRIWATAPIKDHANSYVVISNIDGTVTYPKLDDDSLYKKSISSNNYKKLINFTSSGVDYLSIKSRAIGTEGDMSTDTSWQVMVASPSAIALTPLKNAQIAAVIIIGLLLVSFLWVSAIFVKRTIASILQITGGALIFAGNQLNYRIDINKLNDSEFSKLADTMNRMAERIQTAEQEIDQKNKEFISIATHELKAPMTAIIGNLSMVLEDGAGQIDETARNMTNAAYQGTIRLRNLVTDLLDIARLESGRAKFDIQPLDIIKETQDMIEIQKTPAQQKQVTVSFNPPGPLPRVYADQSKLQIILTNFISNAIKYNRSPGTVNISEVVESGFVKISVADTGLGIPDDQKNRMFQKFFRVEHEDRKNVEGTGLGMYVTKKFIEAMGGKLWFESKHGEGTTFHFTIPTKDPTPKLAPSNLAPSSSPQADIISPDQSQVS